MILGIRPSDMEDVAVWRNDELPTIEVIAEVTEELGSEVNVHLHRGRAARPHGGHDQGRVG